MKAVIYARYSPGPDQREESIEGQIRECSEYAERNGITIVRTYADRGISGRTDNRAEFQRMLKDCEKRLFDAIIVWKINRFGRNREEIAINKVRCRKHGVKVLYAKEHIPDGPEGIILESVLEGMAEYYSANLAQDVKRGMKENALKCMSVGGITPMGYRIGDDKRYEIDPSTAPIVQWIFEQYDSGKSLKSIADALNAKGIKSTRGGPFNKGSFHAMLRNRRYTGVYIFDDVEIEGGMPAIIDKDLFERVQKRLDANKRAPARSKATVSYLLTGKVFCGHCGMPMIGESGTSHTGRVHSYYKCGKAKREHTCNKKPERKEWLENLVVRETVEKVLDDSVINLIAENVKKIQEAERKDSTLQYLEDHLASTEKAIRNLMKAIEQGIITPSTKNRLQELETEKAETESQIAEAKASRVIVTKEQVKYWLRLFKDGNVDNPEYRQRLIDTFVNAVFVYDEESDDEGNDKKIVITYNYTGGQAAVKGSDLTPICPPAQLANLKTLATRESLDWAHLLLTLY